MFVKVTMQCKFLSGLLVCNSVPNHTPSYVCSGRWRDRPSSAVCLTIQQGPFSYTRWMDTETLNTQLFFLFRHRQNSVHEWAHRPHPSHPRLTLDYTFFLQGSRYYLTDEVDGKQIPLFLVSPVSSSDGKVDRITHLISWKLLGCHCLACYNGVVGKPYICNACVKTTIKVNLFALCLYLHYITDRPNKLFQFKNKSGPDSLVTFSVRKNGSCFLWVTMTIGRFFHCVVLECTLYTLWLSPRVAFIFRTPMILY